MNYSKNEMIYKYRLISYIGGGDFGEVWLANDTAIDVNCALKLLPKNDTSIDERLLETKIGFRLQHPNVVNIKYADVIQHSDTHEFVLSDYGITCFSPEHLAVHPRQCYLTHTAPETFSQNIYDERTDIYQIGMTAFRLFNGISEIKVDFIEDPNKFKEKVLEGKVITNSKHQPFIPNKIRRIISKAIARNPNDRFQGALEMRRALEQLLMKGTCSSDCNGNIIFDCVNSTYR